ncbi:MAG: cation:proton antiporter [Candidatus Marinimicrobia bacterium]|nr:cation:proton antiporter [Candidatus Neomarinimicrobiota bacterium]
MFASYFLDLSALFIVGFITIIGYYFGKNIRYIKLPSIIGYMLLGVLIGPSLFGIITDASQANFGFITDIALGFVAFSIGLELRMITLRKLGKSIVYIILLESLGAFIVVFGGIYLLTGNLPLALIFAALAPASAPAGTVAVIREYKAQGSLTQALYAVVGFDDGLGIIIFGFTAALVEFLLGKQSGHQSGNFGMAMLHPLMELGLSTVVGLVFGGLFSWLARKLKSSDDLFVLIFGFILIVSGLSISYNLSLIFSNMVMGFLIVNTQPHSLNKKLHDQLHKYLPILFILFFTLAGTNLHISKIPALGLIGVIYALSRTVGLVGGSKLGALIGGASQKLRKYIGLGILSQAGVAIGLALAVKKDFAGLGEMLDSGLTSGDHIGAVVLTTITVTCIFFEFIGPILAKYGLKKAGEINTEE